MLIGTIVSEGGLNYNAMILADGGRVVGRTLKRELPTTARSTRSASSRPGPLPEPIEFRGVKIGVPICEDIWQEVGLRASRRSGRRDPAGAQRQPLRARQGRQARSGWSRSRVLETGLPIAYLNRVGGQDELVFDGSSFVMHPDGERVVQMPDWDEALLLTEWARDADGWRCATRASHELDPFPGGRLPGDDGRRCATM